MNDPLTASQRMKLEKAASDHGFDLPIPAPDGWLGYRSHLCPLRIWLSSMEGLLMLAVSDAAVWAALGSPIIGMALPEGAVGAVGATDIVTFYALLERAYQLSLHPIPSPPPPVPPPSAPVVVAALVDDFQRETAHLPQSTEAERLVVQRVGQGIFRKGLDAYWNGRCAVTGLSVRALLRASHIKPWADCATDAERLDPFNGLLLAAHLDAAFDQGLLTLEDDGTLRIASVLDEAARHILGLHPSLQVPLTEPHRHYLRWHRSRVFREE